jgi:hypothetical protein
MGHPRFSDAERNQKPGPRQETSSIVKCYNPAGSNSQERYDWITKHLANAVEEAVDIRSKSN